MDLKVASRKLSPFSHTLSLLLALYLSLSLCFSLRVSPGSSSLQCLAFCVDVRPTKTSKCEFYRLLLAWTDCQLNSSFRKIGNAHQIKTVSYAASECFGSANWFVVRLCHATEWEQNNNNNRRRCEFSEIFCLAMHIRGEANRRKASRSKASEKEKRAEWRTYNSRAYVITNGC